MSTPPTSPAPRDAPRERRSLRGRVAPAWRGDLLARAASLADSRRGLATLFLAALLVYAVAAVAWPLERGRDSWDYWLYFLQLPDVEPPFSALQAFRTPVAPVVVGLPMLVGGSALLEAVLAVVFAGSVAGMAWAVRPLGRAVSVATGLVMLVNVPYMGLFHEVSSDFVFAALLAPLAGALIRAMRTGAARPLVALGLAAAALTLTRPASQVLVPLVVVAVCAAPRGALRRRVLRAGLVLAAAVLPLVAWAALNSVRYDDFAVARGGKAWVPFFKVASDVDLDNGPASRRLADAITQRVLPLEPYRERGVDVDTYLRGIGNLEVIRLIALSDDVFGWDDDYQVLFDAALEAIEQDPGGYARGVADTLWQFVWQRYAPDLRERPVPFEQQPAELLVEGRRMPAPLTVSPVVEAVRYGFVWCPTDDLERCVVPDPGRALGSPSQARRYEQLVARIREWNRELPRRDSVGSLASKGATLSWHWPRSALWILAGAALLAVRRPRGAAPVWTLVACGLVVLLVHALSQAPQNEFALPFQPFWVLALVAGLCLPGRARDPRPGAPSRDVPPETR